MIDILWDLRALLKIFKVYTHIMQFLAFHSWRIDIAIYDYQYEFPGDVYKLK